MLIQQTKVDSPRFLMIGYGFDGPITLTELVKSTLVATLFEIDSKRDQIKVKLDITTAKFSPMIIISVVQPSGVESFIKRAMSE